ncbi:MAG: hypothetical protein KF833_02215 [Verrucomicrobiae bacterium]|nr:hypothetical protein [Verrucomicrobiae bacterium]
MRHGWRLCLGMWLGLIPWAEGTRWVPLTIEELAARADAVVHGRVEGLTVLRDAGGRIYRRVEVRAIEVWRGVAGGVVWEVVAGGGVLGERLEAAQGQVEYRVGEEVVCFLVRNPAGEWVTLGLAQGAFRVREEGGRRWVANPFWGGAAGAGRDRHGGWPADRPLAIEELRRRTLEVER